MSLNEVIMLCVNGDLPPKPETDPPDEANYFFGYLPNKKAA
jgi:hypothetical protein